MDHSPPTPTYPHKKGFFQWVFDGGGGEGTRSIWVFETHFKLPWARLQYVTKPWANRHRQVCTLLMMG